MSVILRERLSPGRAQLTTDYRVTDGYCVELYHIISGPAILTVKVRGLDNRDRPIATTTMSPEVRYVDKASCINFSSWIGNIESYLINFVVVSVWCTRKSVSFYLGKFAIYLPT